MKRKQPYKAPAILREVCLQLDRELLDASIVDKTGIISNGQKVNDIDASDTQNFDWNNSWNWDQN